MDTKKVGMIGLGIMGKPMAKNIIKAGYELTIVSSNKNTIQELLELGANIVSSPKEVGLNSDVIVTMLPNSPQVKEVLFNENGLLEGTQKGKIIIDMSSISPLASKEVYDECKQRGVEFLDAPVSGGEAKAIDGTLSIMVGGNEDVLNEVKDLLSCMGASVVWCGEIGAGNITKLVNQVIVALNLAAITEGMMLAVKAGVDPTTVFNAIKGGAAGSTMMTMKTPQIIDRNFKPGFKMDLHTKDLVNAVEAGHGYGSPLILTSMVLEMYQNLRASGLGQEDHSALAKYYEKLTGMEIASK